MGSLTSGLVARPSISIILIMTRFAASVSGGIAGRAGEQDREESKTTQMRKGKESVPTRRRPC